MNLTRYQKKNLIKPAALLMILCSWTIPAYAYLDPGTGSMLIQGIIGAVAAIGVTLKLYWHKVKIMFSGSKEDSDEDNQPEDPSPKS